jgi:hypothetical protein
MVESAPERGRVLNAVALQNAVLCAECDVVSDSPHDQCLVCGSVDFPETPPTPKDGDGLTSALCRRARRL